MSNGIFNFKFLALLLSEILVGPKFTLEGLRPLDAPERRNFFTQSEYFTMSNCVFNFNTSSSSTFWDIRGSQIYVREPCASLYVPERKIFCTRGEYATMSNGVFYFNFLALLLSEILGGC